MRRIPALCLLVILLSCEKKPSENQPGPKPANVASPEVPHAVSPIVRANMSAEFLDAFKETKECGGIQLSPRDEKTPADFKAQASFGTADTPEKEEEWRWTLFDVRHDPNGEFRGAGNQTSPAEAMRDMCTNIWETFKREDKRGQ
jgi:hypothetical protein